MSQFTYRARVLFDGDPYDGAEVVVIDADSDDPTEWYVVDGGTTDADGIVEFNGLIGGEDRHHLIGQADDGTDGKANGLSVPFAALDTERILEILAGDTYNIGVGEREYYDAVHIYDEIGEDGGVLEIEDDGAVEIAQITNP